MNIRRIDTAATFACFGSLLCWSVGPIFIKYLTGYLDVWTQNLLRYTAGCLFWLPFLLYAIRKKTFDNSIWRKALAPALANIIMQSLWASAFYYINPAFMSLLSKSSIIWIATFSLVFFPDERALVKSTRFWLGIILAATGVIGVMVFKEDFAATKTITGIAIGLAAAGGWSVYTITARIAFKDVDSRSSFSVVTIYTVAGLLVLALILGRISDCVKMPPWPWACVVISGVISIAFSHVLYYAALKRIGATIPSLVLLSSPFIIFSISHVVFGESLNVPQLLFGMILLSGSALAIWAQQHLK
jgi:drug/metabolite transporter (DMT)-like permease